MKYKVTISSLFINGVKYRRGDIVDLESGDVYGVNLELVPDEPVIEKPKRRTRVKKVNNEN